MAESDASGWVNPAAGAWHRGWFIAFLAVWVAEVADAALGLRPGPAWPVLDFVLLLLAAATLAVGLARRLPAQSVLSAAAIVGGLTALLAALNGRLGVPFGPLEFPGGGPLAPAVPFIWITVVLGGRGVARLILRPHRRMPFYGFWVIGLTALLAVLWELAFEPLLPAWAGWWSWNPSAAALQWQGVPATCFLGWGVAITLILGFATPWLLNKQPVRQPVDWHPLVVWVLLFTWMAVFHFRGPRTAPAIVATVTALLGLAAAVRGGRHRLDGGPAPVRSAE